MILFLLYIYLIYVLFNNLINSNLNDFLKVRIDILPLMLMKGLLFLFFQRYFRIEFFSYCFTGL